MESEKKTENQNNKNDKNDKIEKDEIENLSKVGFFKKVWYSITKIEKYPDMSAQGFGKAISYLSQIVLIISIVFCLGIIYQVNNIVKEGTQYLQNSFPEFSYKDGTLNVESDGPIEISEDNSIMGRVIIDTKVDSQDKINQYLNEITKTGEGAVILKDQIIIKNSMVSGSISYSYKDTLSSFKLTEFTKQDVINYANSSKIITLYVSVFITVLIYVFVMYFITTLSNAVLLSFIGYITTWIAKIKMRYVAVFNMAVYALTLSVILNILYVAINIFTTFNMEYFQVMYIAVATIYLVAAILILKTEFMKKQMELMKIAEAQDIIRKQLEEKDKKEETKDKPEEKKQEENDKKEDEKGTEEKGKSKENKKDNNVGEEPQGSNA